MSRTIAVVCLLLPISVLVWPAVAEDGPTVDQCRELRSNVARLLEELDSDQFESRRRAAEELEAMVAQPALGRLLAVEFQQVLLGPDVSFEVRWHVERWMTRLPQVEELQVAADVKPEHVGRLIDKLGDDSYAVRLGAARRLQWLLSQSEYLPRVKQSIESRLGEPLEADVSRRLREMLELTRPAMVAEYWEGRHHLGEQHLMVGVPSMAEGAQRPSHFDRIDDETAHCISGNTLSPGDYPVAVAFPHPVSETAFFHLVNLPTPRRRLAYSRYVKKNEALRLADLSRRTLDRLLQQKRALTEPELMMLAQLDPKEVSRFAGNYLCAVEDEQLPSSARLRAAGRTSRHGMVCFQLAVEGTNNAMPGLLTAIAEKRFLPPTTMSPYRLHLLAALSVAARDPWPEADVWLADQIQRSDLLIDGQSHGPELGATAAALLLQRRGQVCLHFGIQPAAESLLIRLGVDGQRFTSDDARRRVLQWWQQQRKKA